MHSIWLICCQHNAPDNRLRKQLTCSAAPVPVDHPKMKSPEVGARPCTRPISSSRLSQARRSIGQWCRGQCECQWQARPTGHRFRCASLRHRNNQQVAPAVAAHERAHLSTRACNCCCKEFRGGSGSELNQAEFSSAVRPWKVKIAASGWVRRPSTEPRQHRLVPIRFPGLRRNICKWINRHS